VGLLIIKTMTYGVKQTRNEYISDRTEVTLTCAELGILHLTTGVQNVFVFWFAIQTCKMMLYRTIIFSCCFCMGMKLDR
jgi:hypothetical protein